MPSVADNLGQAQQTPAGLPKLCRLFHALTLAFTVAVLHTARWFAAIAIVVEMIVDFLRVAVVGPLHHSAMMALAMHFALISGPMLHTRLRAVFFAAFAVRFAHIVHRVEFLF